MSNIKFQWLKYIFLIEYNHVSCCKDIILTEYNDVCLIIIKVILKESFKS
jgi:hypothetical protein